MLLSPSSRVQGRLARRAGSVVVARLSIHSKSIASHGQRRSRPAAFGFVQRRSFSFVSSAGSFARKTLKNSAQEFFRDRNGKILGGLGGLFFGLLLFGPRVAYSVIENFQATHDGPYNRASSIVVFSRFTDRRDWSHAEAQAATIGIFASALLWPMPLVGIALFVAMGAVLSFPEDNFINRMTIAYSSKPGPAPLLNIQQIAEKGDTDLLIAEGFDALTVPRGEEFERLRAVIANEILLLIASKKALHENLDAMRKLVAMGKATEEDLKTIVSENAALRLARPMNEYQLVHRKIAEVVCRIEAGATEDELAAEYKELITVMRSTYMNVVVATYRRRGSYLNRERATPNIYVRPTYFPRPAKESSPPPLEELKGEEALPPITADDGER